MTTDDPESQAERRRVGGLLQEILADLRDEGVGAKIRQRRSSATQLAKFL